jgi:hypothetical protein
MMPTDNLSSGQMARLLMALEAAEQEVDDDQLLGLGQLADLHEQAKAELNPDPKDRSVNNPIVERIATAMVKRRAQGTWLI